MTNKLSVPQVYNLARGAGLDPASAVIATAIAGAESGLDADAVGDVGLQDATWGPSIGLWQIRSLKAQTGTGGTRDANRLKDPTFNASAMASISGVGKAWSAWSTYTSGAYKKYVGAASSGAAGAATAAPLPTTSAPTTTSGTSGSTENTGFSLNPFSGWQKDLTSLSLKLAFVGVGGTLLTLGVLRLVSPTVTSALKGAGA